MKLVKQEESSWTFLIGNRERDLLIALLLRYPVIPAAHFRPRGKAKDSGAAVDPTLLQDALAEQQKESRRHLEEWLGKEDRFKETDQGYLFSLTPSEREWMLQVLNDIRVGSWIELGEPDPKTGPIEPTEQTMPFAWSLEMAGWFQHFLLQASLPQD